MAAFANIRFRFEGKITADGKPVMTQIRLVNGMGTVFRAVESDAHGVFYFEDLLISKRDDPTIEVLDPRFGVYSKLIELDDPSRKIIIELTPSGEGAKTTTSGEQPSGTSVDFSAIAASYPAAAVAEFTVGIREAGIVSKNDSAEAHFKKAVEISPEFYEAYLQLGLLQAGLNQNADAIASLENASILKPREVAPLRVLGHLYVDANHPQKAVETYARFLPNRMGLEDRYYLATALLSLGQTSRARNN